MLEEKMELDEEIGRLNKTVNEQANEIIKMRNDYKVNAATL